MKTSSYTLAFLVAMLGGMLVQSGASFTGKSASAASCGSLQRAYVAQFSTLAAYGVDGYVGYDPGAGVAFPECNYIADFLNVSPSNANPSTWIQSGVHIGKAPVGMPSQIYRAYEEANNPCTGYNITFYGQPPSTNNAHYISYTGLYSQCFPHGTYYRFAVRLYSWLNPPSIYR